VWPSDADADIDTVALYVRYLNNKLDAVSSRAHIGASVDEFWLEADGGDNAGAPVAAADAGGETDAAGSRAVVS